MPQVQGLKQARKLALELQTDRYRKLDRLERYVHGTQYEGRPDFLAPEVDCPLMERAPNIVYSLTEAAIRQHCDFALGESRFPKLTTGQSEDDSELDDAGLSPEQSKLLDSFLAHLCDHARLPDVAQDALSEAEGCGTAVGIVRASNGRLEVEPVKAKWCTPELAADGRTVNKLVVEYPYIKNEKGADGITRACVYVYKREVTDRRDIVYKPFKITNQFEVPSWSEDTEKSVTHGLGFCPVVWYARERTCKYAEEVDGFAIHATQLDELDALNFSLSQRGRGALYAGDPQMYETGVEEGDDIGPMGREPETFSDVFIGALGGLYRGISGRLKNARRKGAGVVWGYSNPDAKVGLLTLPGDALKSISDHIGDLEDKIGGVLGYTKASPETVKGAVSGKALGFLFARTTGFCDRARRDLWDGYLQPVLSMLLRVSMRLETSAPGSLHVVGLPKVMPLLAKSTEDGDEWNPPRIKPQWGRYFEQTTTDELDCVRTVKEADGIIPTRLKLEKLRQVFPFESASEVEDMLNDEKEEAAKHQQELMASQPQEDGNGVSKVPGAASPNGGVRNGRRPPSAEVGDS